MVALAGGVKKLWVDSIRRDFQGRCLRLGHPSEAAAFQIRLFASREAPGRRKDSYRELCSKADSRISESK